MIDEASDETTHIITEKNENAANGEHKLAVGGVV